MYVCDVSLHLEKQLHVHISTVLELFGESADQWESAENVCKQCFLQNSVVIYCVIFMRS